MITLSHDLFPSLCLSIDYHSDLSACFAGSSVPSLHQTCTQLEEPGKQEAFV